MGEFSRIYPTELLNIILPSISKSLNMMRLVFMLLILHQTCGYVWDTCSHTEINLRAVAFQNKSLKEIEAICAKGSKLLAALVADSKATDPCKEDKELKTPDCQALIAYRCDIGATRKCDH